ncbi:sulfotransferase family cytosolic 2B member 1-like [Arapaima gigas]
MARLEVTENFQGITFPGHLHTQESLQGALSFQFQDTDTLIATYPKSGTTWMQEILTLLHNQGDETMSRTVPNWARAPWLEQFYFSEVMKMLQAPRLITTHLPYHLLAPALKDTKVKVIYVARNPKDIAVSFYHFHKMANFLPEFGSFDEFLNHFLEGSVSYGSWFDHVRGWTKQMTDNVFYITYEEMWLNLRGSLERISAFLGRPLLAEQLNNTQKHCSFSRMKENPMVNYTTVSTDIMDHSKGPFMRKGKIGDWKNMFSEEQNRQFEEVFRTKMMGSALQFIWEAPQDPERLNAATEAKEVPCLSVA